MESIQLAFKRRLRLVPQIGHVGFLVEARQKRPQAFQSPDIRRQFHFAVAICKIRRPGHRQGERNILAQLRRFVFLAMFREKFP